LAINDSNLNIFVLFFFANTEGKMGDDVKKISFRSKTPLRCPICSNEFFREELFSGGGRLIAGKLTSELRRTYEENAKFGKIYPMAYILNVCPRCLYVSFQKDFENLLPEEIDKIRNMSQARIDTVKKYFGNIDFNSDRTLAHGAASYLLAVDIYGLRNKKVAPTFKRAIASIRAAWLFADLAKEKPDIPYGKISEFFYNKAYSFYGMVLELFQNGGEPVEAAGNLGPDTDKNWGYEGVLFLYSSLTVKIGARESDLQKRLENLERTKRYLSRIFGIGKSTKQKPGPLIDMTRDMYDKMNAMIDEIKGQSEPNQ